MIKKIFRGIGCIGILALVWWYFFRNKKHSSRFHSPTVINLPTYKDEEKEMDFDLVYETASHQQPSSTKISKTITKDDLTKINGIGPKISKVFEQAGISTYQQLADLDPTEIQRILAASNIRLAPRYETWSKQAQFATSGDWEGLLKYLEYQK